MCKGKHIASTHPHERLHEHSVARQTGSSGARGVGESQRNNGARKKNYVPFGEPTIYIDPWNIL